MHKHEDLIEITGEVEGGMLGEPRPPRLEFEGAFYHVYNRGNRRERIFWTEADYREFEDFLLDLAGRMSVNLYAWCLMPNHFHVLVETPLGNLSAIMQRLLGSYARHFNRIHKKMGHVFQGRYGAKLCDREAYLLELVRYIHLNPYRVKKPGFVPEEGWPWSSHRYYMNGEEPMAARPFIHAVLRRFSEDIVKARERYARFVADGLAHGDWQDFYVARNDQFLGSEGFIEASKRKAGLPVRQAQRLERMAFQDLVFAVARQFHLEPTRLLEQTKNRAISQARQALVYLAKRYARQSTNNLAGYLGKDPAAISYLYRQAEARGETEAMQAILLTLLKEPELKVPCE